jgi:hypothetical protein
MYEPAGYNPYPPNGSDVLYPAEATIAQPQAPPIVTAAYAPVSAVPIHAVTGNNMERGPVPTAQANAYYGGQANVNV